MGGESAPFKAQTSYGIYTDHIKRLLSSSGSVPIQHVQYAGREKLQVTMTQGYVIKTTYSSALRNKRVPQISLIFISVRPHHYGPSRAGQFRVHKETGATSDMTRKDALASRPKGQNIYIFKLLKALLGHGCAVNQGTP
jgi:hypothetical protein